MDDDIRSRFRGARGGDDIVRPQPPLPSPPKPISVPRPVSQPKPVAPKQPRRPLRPMKLDEPIIKIKPKRPRKKRSLKKTLLMLLVMLLIVGGGAGYGYYRYKHPKPTKAQIITEQTSTAPELKPTGTIRLIASGDNLTFDTVNNNAKKADGSYDYAPMYAHIKPFFDKSDIRICNESVPAAGTLTGITGYPSFNAPPQFAKGLSDVGCNVINMGSKNINDKGQAAIDTSVSFWDNQSALLAVAGANRSQDEQNKIRYFTTKQVKFAFLSYVTATNSPQQSPFSINAYSDAVADQQIAEARKNAQIVIVNISWGADDQKDISADQDRIAQHLADDNADIVIGNGTHTLLPAKILNGKDNHQSLVWFSLGNMLNSQLPIDNLVGGIAVMDIDVATQNIKNPELLPVYMHYEWTADQKKQNNLGARHNLGLYPLDQATNILPQSQTGTTAQAQLDRVKGIITKFAPIKVLTSSEF